VIVENSVQLEEFKRIYDSEDCIVVPIQCNTNKHSVNDELSLLYVQLWGGKEFILPFNHSETLNIEISNLQSNTKKYTYDKKQLNHLIELDNVVDVNLMYYMATNNSLYIEDADTNTHHFFNMRYYRKENINTIIPVLKHLEKCRKIAKILKDTIEKYTKSVNMSYNDAVLNNLGYIENNGLQTVNGMVYSEYNIYTSTGRPSNRFGGINFAALNKTDGSRKQFISRFKDGMLVEMDYDGYHLRLIADKVGYQFPEGSVHTHMANLYGVSYDEAKSLSFQYLYGYIPVEIRENNEYFNLVGQYIDSLWKSYNSENFIISDIYKRRIFRKNLFEMNRNKLFNYTVQLEETECNMRVLNKLIPEIEDYSSKLVSYNYDSFLFDVDLNDGKEYILKVKSILEQNGKFPVKVSYGSNYHEMKDITEKFV